MKKFLRKSLITLLVLVLLAVLAYFLKDPFLRGVGNFLIKEDTLQRTEALFVLSGGSYERGLEAAKIYQNGYTPLIIPTGANESKALQAVGIRIADAFQTQRALLNHGVDSAAILPYAVGTSTFEESEQILGYSIQQGYERIMVVSSKFHTRRIQRVFKEKFSDAGIDVIVRGSDPIGYQTERWWESEPGLIFVNNEYIKLIYYMFKY